jgi:hypothetical protein
MDIFLQRRAVIFLIFILFAGKRGKHFHPLCSSASNEKMKFAGYCRHLRLFSGGQLSELMIAGGKRVTKHSVAVGTRSVANVRWAMVYVTLLAHCH